MDKTARCRRCGSGRVGWVQSTRSGKWYLAFATPTHSVQVDGHRSGETGHHIHRHILHRCDEPNTGGFDACTLCGRHHMIPFGQPRQDWCERYPDAP